MFAEQVARAIDFGLRLVLAHEMPGRGQATRHPVPFDCFFDDRHTPSELKYKARQLYAEVAVPLKGGDLRPTSLALLASKIAGESKLSRLSFSPTRTGLPWWLLGVQPRNERARVHVGKTPEGDGVELLMSQGGRAIERSTS